MSNLVQQTQSAIESALILGDLSKLNTDQRLSYYKSVCESVGLNPLTKPFDYINLNGKLVLYAKRDATDQLRKIHGVSIKITAREKIEDIYIVTALATDKTGRFDESTGAVNVSGLKGDNLANAFLKAETKAKRRVTLSLCGLGLLDETEVHSIPDAKPFVEPSQAQQNVSGIKEVMQELNQSKVEKVKMTPADQIAEAIIESPIVMHGDYVVKFGKLKGIQLNQTKDYELKGYLTWLMAGAETSGKPLTANAQELIDRGTLYLASLQQTSNQDSEPEFDLSEPMPS